MAQKINKYDVVIVGAGVIGSALALRLAQLHYHVALLDMKSPLFEATDPERVIALSEGSSRYLKALGVWDAVLAHGAGHIKDIVVLEPDAETGLNGTNTMDMSHTEINADALGYVCEIRHVLQPIQQALESHVENNQVEMLCPATCLGFEHSETGVSLAIQTEQGKQRIKAQLLVGADGTPSQIRKLAGIETFGWDHNRMGIVASITAEQGHGHVAYECFKAQGPLALLPLADDRFSLVWSVAPRDGVQLLRLDDQSFLDKLEQEVGQSVLERTGAFKGIGERASFPLELRLAKSFAQAGLALVGNAAHTIHPIAGQGMNLGLRDVAVLADVLQQDWAKENLSSSLVAQTYAERRRLDTLAVAGFTEGVLETFGSTIMPTRWLRGQGLNMMQTSPSLKQILLQQAAGLAQLKGVQV